MIRAMAEQEKAATLGCPSYVWRTGQERRFALVREAVPLEGAYLLDAGCGVGLYLRRFRTVSEHVYGVDIDFERAAEAGADLPNIVQASVERLPFAEACFDVIFSHEVLEHVGDDRAAVREAYRTLKPGGYLALFVPNRGYPFETHGIFWRGRYRYGNIPLVNYLPNPLRSRLCPHVRAYTRREIRRLFEGLAGEIVLHRGIFAGYDRLAARHPRLGRWLREVTYRLEKTPLQWLGLSHWLVFRKALSQDSEDR